MSMQNLSISIWEAYPNLQKEKGIQKWTGIVVKSGKTWGTVQKDYHQIGVRTVKCHKSRITLWEKAILQPKKNQKSADIKQSVNIYKPGNFKLINFLKFT